MGFDYHNTFISVADDCPADVAEVPPTEYRGKPTIAGQEFAMLHGHDFEITMAELLSSIWVLRRGGPDMSDDERETLRAEYFGEGRACLRASPLAKKYGWGFVFDAHGRVALVASDDSRYVEYVADEDLDQLKAMRSSRK